MSKKLPILFNTIILSLICLSPQTYGQTNAGVSAVLNPQSGSTLVIGSSFPVTAEVFNNGTTTITSMQLKFNIGTNNIALDEIWTGPSFAPGDTMTYTFTAEFTLDDTTSGNSVYCLADAPGDMDPWNNSTNPVYYFSATSKAGIEAEEHRNSSIEYFTVIPGSQLKLGITNGGIVSVTKALIIGADGRHISTQNTTGLGQSSEMVFDISSLPRGLYLIVVKNEFGQLVKKFVI